MSDKAVTPKGAPAADVVADCLFYSEQVSLFHIYKNRENPVLR
jgi:hypothetical protein